MRLKKLSLFTLLNITLSTITFNASATAKKNIIMVVADGMGPAYVSAYRYFKDNPNSLEVESTIFDKYLIGKSSTYPHLQSGYLTDSAASATALASGIKTYNGAIGININKQAVHTVADEAKLQGMKVGLVVTSQINHATPAAYITHNENRESYNEIAYEYIKHFTAGKLDLALGGGWQYFLQGEPSLLQQFTKTGGHYINHYDALPTLKEVPQGKPVLGLFSDIALPRAIDDSNPQRLLALTQAAIEYMENDDGFFLLIEASQIDWAGHANDVVSAMGEMDDLAATLNYLDEYVQKNSNTLVVVTADHSTGGLTLSSNYKKWQPELLRSIKHSPHFFTKYWVDNEITLASSQAFNLPFTLQDLAIFKKLKYKEKKRERKDIKSTAPLREHPLFKEIVYKLNEYSNTGWTTHGHTAVDVPIFSWGKGSKAFSGQLDNTDIAKKLFNHLKNP